MTGEDCSQPPDGCCRDHVAGLVDDVEMHGVAAHLAEAADRWLAGAHGADRLAIAFGAAQSLRSSRKPSTEPGMNSSDAVSFVTSLRRASL